MLPTLVVFFAVMVVVLITFGMSRNTVNRELNRNISDYTNNTQGDIQDRLNIFEELLRAGVGLVTSNNQVTQQQWEDFINTSAILQRYPGAQSVGYAQVIKKPDLPAFTTNAQAWTNPGYTIHPGGDRDLYVPVLYLSPNSEDNKKILGFDINSEQVRRLALEQARDTGNVTLSGAVQSVVDTGPDGLSFIMYAPQYARGMPTDTVEHRRAAISGYVYAGFRINKFLSTVVTRQSNENIAFSIPIPGTDKLLYKSPHYDEIMSRNHKTQLNTVQIAGVALRFEYVYNPDRVLPQLYSKPYGILVFGMITALLIALAVWLILRGRANEILLEQERGINEAKDNLLSLASHQLRTPATGVKQYLGMVLQGFAGDITKQQKSLLEKAYAGNERQLKTINEVLYLAKLEAGRIVLTRTNFSISQMIQDLVAEVQDDVSEKEHNLVVKLPKTHKDYRGDEHMIRMAVENLITNAVKYTHAEGVITIRLTYGKENVQISVEDNGVGIPEDQQSKMFKQFERIDNDLSITVGGSGIGLYVVQNVVKMHGGEITVRSSPEQGSKFTITLPFEVANNNDKV